MEWLYETTEECENVTETFIQQTPWLHSNKIQRYAVRTSALKMFLIILSGDIELNPGSDICLNRKSFAGTKEESLFIIISLIIPL